MTKIKFKFDRMIPCYVRDEKGELVEGYEAIFLPENDLLCSGVHIWRTRQSDGTLENTIFELSEVGRIGQSDGTIANIISELSEEVPKEPSPHKNEEKDEDDNCGIYGWH